MLIGTTGVYGDRQGALTDETCPVHPHTARAKRRVASEQTLRRWRRGRSRAGLGDTPTGGILRVPGIYAADRLPTDRLRSGTPALRPEDDTWTNHIHADDLARACQLALWRGKPQRSYNVNDDTQLRMGDYFDQAASVLGLPKPARISRAQAQTELPAMQLSFMSESRRMVNTRMKRELRLQLRFAHIKNGLA